MHPGSRASSPVRSIAARIRRYGLLFRLKRTPDIFILSSKYNTLHIIHHPATVAPPECVVLCIEVKPLGSKPFGNGLGWIPKGRPETYAYAFHPSWGAGPGASSASSFARSIDSPRPTEFRESWSQWHMAEHDMTLTILLRGAIAIPSCGFEIMPDNNEGEGQ